MGVDADPRAEPKLDCPENELLKFSGPLGRRLVGCCCEFSVNEVTQTLGDLWVPVET